MKIKTGDVLWLNYTEKYRKINKRPDKSAVFLAITSDHIIPVTTVKTDYSLKDVETVWAYTQEDLTNTYGNDLYRGDFSLITPGKKRDILKYIFKSFLKKYDIP